MIAMSRASLVTGWSTEATPGWLASAADTSVDGRPGDRCAVGVEDDFERTVDTGAVAVGHQVVCLAGRRVRSVVARVGEAQVHREDRDREDGEDQCGCSAVPNRPGDDPRRPPRGPGVRVVGRLGLDERDPGAVDAVLDDAEHRGQQRDGGQHRDRHHDRRAVAHHRHHRDAGHLQPEDRDDDGDAREQDRQTRSRVGAADGDGHLCPDARFWRCRARMNSA